MLAVIKFIVCLNILSFASCDHEGSPIVTTAYGVLKGTWLKSQEGRNYAAFMSVPYAKPPVGSLRFEPPVEKDKWDGVWDASQPTPMCLAWSHLLSPNDTRNIKGQEDCLYLNIYTPKIDSNEKLPVIVFIHGGAFMFSGSRLWGSKYFMDRDVVLVSINYRVGPLGFLSFEDSVQPGNNGLRDQVMALKWTKQNIETFGGDKSSITLMGQSAGGASVHYHYLSPLSRGLFDRGISLSGSALNCWALVDAARAKALQLAASVGCPILNDTKLILNCLKSRPAENILLNVAQFQEWYYSPFTPFGPVIETNTDTQDVPAFLPESPIKLMRKREMLKAPWMTGVTTAEGLYPASSFVAVESDLTYLDENFEKLLPHLLDYNFTLAKENLPEVAKKIRQEYFGSKNITSDTVPQLIKMMSDRLFVADTEKVVELAVDQNISVYYYEYNFRGSRSISDFMSGTNIDFGVSHADEMILIFNVSFASDKFTTADLDMQSVLLDVTVSFAKHGKPESKNLEWEVSSKENSYALLKIDSPVSLEMTSYKNYGNLNFWESIPFNENN